MGPQKQFSVSDAIPGPKKVYNFDKFWKLCPVSRPTKEALKMVLFTLFPFFFRNWAIFENWKSARIFRPEGYSLCSSNFLKDIFKDKVSVAIPAWPTPVSAAGNDLRLAVVIHAFYRDVFTEILQKIDFSIPGIGLFITTTEELYEEITGITGELQVPCRVMTVKNHGRDILPFFTILPEVLKEGYDIVLKLHTKKSNHLNRKELWLHDLTERLIGQGAMSRAITIFKHHPEIGMIGPAGHILPMHLYYGANGRVLAAIAEKMNIRESQLHGLCFAAGSMFYTRMEVLKPLLGIGLTEAHFEFENQQVDGTMAHVIERAFVLGLKDTGTWLADTDYEDQHRILTINRNHYFTI